MRIKLKCSFIIISIYVLIFLSYPNTGLGQEHDNSFVFRKIRWGMAKDEVIAGETLELIDTVKFETRITKSFGPDETAAYIGDAESKDVLIIYGFYGNCLTNAIQFFTEQYEDKSPYIEAYDLHKAELTERYGLPLESGDLWLDDGFYDNRATDLDAGNLSLYSTWENSITKVDLLLTKNINTNKIIHMVFYGSKLIKREN